MRTTAIVQVEEGWKMNAKTENLHRVLYPRQTVLVTSSFNGHDNVMAADWSTPVSFDPFMVAVSIGKTRHSLELISKSGEFVLSAVPLSLKENAMYAGTHCGREEDKFKQGGIARDKAWKVNAPLLRDAVANFECKVKSEVDAGDHVLFVGEVVEAHVDKNAITRGNKLFNKGGREFLGL